MARVRLWVWLALALSLLSCSSYSTSPPPSSSRPNLDCAPLSLASTISSGWHFRTDPDDTGVKHGWFLPSSSSVGWTELTPGEPWEFSGLEYDGVAWYRAMVTLPDWPDVYLGFGDVDDVATLWVNGEKLGTWEGLDGRAVIVDMLTYSNPNEQIFLALRVEDRGGYGGIKQPLRLGDEPRSVMTESQYVTWLADSHPSWPMPTWAQNGPVAWTMTGRLGTADEALLSSDGAIAPWAAAPSVELWIYDHTNGLLASSVEDSTRFWLTNDDLPIPQWEWEAFGVHVRNVLFGSAHDPAVHWHVSVNNDSDTARDLSAIVILRPFAIYKGISPICRIGMEGKGRLRLNGEIFMVSSTPPSKSGVGLLADTMEAAVNGSVPAEQEINNAKAGNGAAVWVYPLVLGAGNEVEIQFSFPSAPGVSLSRLPQFAKDTLGEAVADWEEATSRVKLDVPDDLVEQGTSASIGYLLLSLDPDGPHPGPLAHDALWVRDAAYAGLALIQFGHADAVRATMETVLAAQEDSGRIPPILGKNAPWDDDEWDAQGQSIFLATSYYRYTGDLESLRKWYPGLRSAAEFIGLLRASTSRASGPTQGLLPPSKSAEDLGSPDWHHYWDDFWALAGLQEAAYAAHELGKLEDAARMQKEAKALSAAIISSIEAVMGIDPIYIPGSVENVAGSAMARGTVPAVWPVEVMPGETPLLSRSFDYYHRLWIDPDKGGFRHVQGQFWPYGGLELAHAYLRLDRLDVLHQILGWTLTNQTLPGTFAWAEQVNPSEGGFSGGDMPHAWAAASYATLVREMVISEYGDALELFSGVPDWWLSDGQVIKLENAPTHFGTLNLLHTASTVKQSGEGWHGELIISLSGATPANGFRWHLPHNPTSVDGPLGTTVDDNWLVIRDTGEPVSLTFTPDH